MKQKAVERKLEVRVKDWEATVARLRGSKRATHYNKPGSLNRKKRP